MAEQRSQVAQHGNREVVFNCSGIKIECFLSHKKVSLKTHGFFLQVVTKQGLDLPSHCIFQLY